MSEEDFQTLKTQQGLLVDFGAFGQKFIDLLNLCERDERSTNPKFQLQIYTKDPLPFDHNNACLNINEINTFKHLCHLQLTFMPGNDSDVKKYLANCLQQLRESHVRLGKEYDESKTSLHQRLESTQNALSQKSNELDRLKIEIETQTERLNNKYQQEINFEKEKSLQNQYQTQQKYEKEKKELEMNFTKIQKQLEQRLGEFEGQNKDLVDKKYKNESQLQELRSKYSSLAEEHNSLKQELQAIRKQNTNLDSDLHQNERAANLLRTRIAVLEQEVKDKDELYHRTQDLLTNEQSLKKTYEDVSIERGNEIKKLQANANQQNGEVNKGNEIIKSLQMKLQNLQKKLKIKNDTICRQEKVVVDNQREVGELKSELKSVQESLRGVSEENKDLKNMLNKKTLELEEAVKTIKKEEFMIQWLNKQITETKMSGNENVAPSIQFKPFGTLSSSTTTTTTTTVPSSLNNTRLTNLHDYTNGTISNGILRTGSLNKNNSEPAFEHQQRQQYQQTTNNYIKNLNSSSSSSSSSAAIGVATTGQSNRLDPKYFLPQASTGGLDSTSATTLSIKTTRPLSGSVDTTKLSTTNGGGGGVRINKQLIQPQQISPNGFNQQQAPINNTYAALMGKSNPSLASAYFPTN